MQVQSGGARLSAEAQASLFARGKAMLAVKATEDQGLALILEAAHQGHGEAAHFMALMLATDGEHGDRFAYALAYLGRAAKASHRLAQATLALLADDRHAAAAIARGDNLEEQAWHRLHDAIDPAPWLVTPTFKTLSSAPHIAAVEGLVPPRLCDWIVERARPRLTPARTYNPEDASGRNSGRRTNSDTIFAFDERDLAMLLVSHRAMQLTRLKFAALEPFSVLHYRPGQEFKPHFDFLDPQVPAYAAQVAEVGQRLFTMLVYLNDDFTGGETDFPRLNIRFKGRKGDALLFRNVDEAGAPDFRTLHAGLPPANGEKWLLSQWIRGAPVR